MLIASWVPKWRFWLIHNCAKQPDFRPIRRKHSDAFVEIFSTESCAAHRRAFDRVGRVDAHERHRSWPDTRACQGEPGDRNACSEEQTATTAADRYAVCQGRACDHARAAR